jgi:hypothetical protein
MVLPRLYRVTQKFAKQKIGALDAAIRDGIEKLFANRTLPKGSRIGVTAGSRGISNIVEILRHTIRHVQERGFLPVLVAAMGSHGGGTAEGQTEVLTSLGITPQTMGVPVLTGSETVEVGRTADGLSAYLVRHAFELDGIVVVNRVKPHTGLIGPIQSGLTKSCVVGLGGPSGAQQFHSLGVTELPKTLRDIGTVLLQNTRILGGLAIVENSYEQTAHITALRADRFLEEEPEILALASRLMPRLPVDELDMLIVEEMGKNYSGTGVDTNIIGRLRIHGIPEPSRPAIKRIVVLDLSEESHGNANGAGCVDFITDKLFAKIDTTATYLNCMTTTFVQRGFIPLHFPSEKQTIEMAVASLGLCVPERLRLMIVPNTLHLEKLLVSEPLVKELEKQANLEIDPAPLPFAFDSELRMANRLLRKKPAPEALGAPACNCG